MILTFCFPCIPCIPWFQMVFMRGESETWLVESKTASKAIFATPLPILDLGMGR